MNKININVPSEIRYISDWIDFDNNILLRHSIINKTVTGCGFTHYCLTNSIPTILCSPRKFLLENKHSQLPGTYLVINNGEKALEVDQDLNSKDYSKNKDNEPDTNEIFNIIYNLKSNLSQYLLNCHLSQKTPKILVTYDSLKHVLDVLGESIKEFSVIVDEFQNIFIDSRFKASTELNFVEYLQCCPNVTYLSATPMLEEYLEQLDEFKDLPYYEFIWDPSKIIKANITRKRVRSITSEVCDIIKDYKNGKFPRKVLEDGTIYESREAVFYLNSVKNIYTIINKMKLNQSEVNVICSNIPKNIQKLKKLRISIGTAPKKGEPHKMFTFCTRTVYSGADFYSTNASTIICSDCNVDSLAVDISLDLPQIIGRQRLEENVFKYDATLLYKLSNSECSEENFQWIVNSKLSESKVILDSVENLISDINKFNKYIEFCRLNIKVNKYNSDYVGISEKAGQLKINNLVLIAEKRAFQIQSSTYRDDINLYNELSENFNISDISLSLDINLELQNFLQDFEIDNNFERRIILYCEFIKKFYNIIRTTDIPGVPQEYKNYMNLLGPDRIRALGSSRGELEREYQIITSGDTRKEIIFNTFQIQQRYTLKEIKEKLGEIYSSLNISKTPKASDLEEYYEVKKCTINFPSGKRENGLEIIKIK